MTSGDTVCNLGTGFPEIPVFLAHTSVIMKSFQSEICLLSTIYIYLANGFKGLLYDSDRQI